MAFEWATKKAGVKRVTYDAEVDCGYVYFSLDQHATKTVPIQIANKGVFGSVNMDISRHGHVIGFEVLGVSTIMPELIEWAKEFT